MITDTLARFVIDTKTGSVPPPVLEAARNALTDTVGVALAGTLEPLGEIATRWVQDLAARRQATFWGHDLGTSVVEAAFANGICSHALDFDDSHPNMRGHPSATLVPAALAVGEASGAPGRDVLAAYAIGLEVGGKLALCLGNGHYLRGWHTTATAGVFGATAVAARLWGLDAGALRKAWGLAASQMSGLVRNFGTMTKPFHAGHAARCGVFSAWMVRQGFTASDAIFDGENNVFDTYGGNDGAPAAELVQRLGQPWEATEPGIYVKRWPCCYSSHRPIGGLVELIQKHRLQPDEITEVAVGFLPGADTALVSLDPRTGLQGKFSVEYTLAALLLDGKLDLETFTDAMVARPQARTLLGKVRRYRIADEKVYSGISASGYTDIAVTTPRGRFELRVDRVPGSPAWPLTDADRREKFMDCAARVLGDPGAERLFELCQRCGELSDVRELVKATIPAAGTARPRSSSESVLSK
jgi:2-methylcitrate dehydratase PrpD